LNATGKPKDFADKLGISESHLYRILQTLKEEAECPIVFSVEKNSYLYASEGRLDIKFKFEMLDIKGLKTIKGGEIFNFFPLLSKNESICL
jgi:hypothetical protein